MGCTGGTELVLGREIEMMMSITRIGGRTGMTVEEEPGVVGDAMVVRVRADRWVTLAVLDHLLVAVVVTRQDDGTLVCGTPVSITAV